MASTILRDSKEQTLNKLPGYPRISALIPSNSADFSGLGPGGRRRFGLIVLPSARSAHVPAQAAGGPNAPSTPFEIRTIPSSSWQAPTAGHGRRRRPAFRYWFEIRRLEFWMRNLKDSSAGIFEGILGLSRLERLWPAGNRATLIRQNVTLIR